MKNFLRIVMFVLIIAAVAYTTKYLLESNEIFKDESQKALMTPKKENESMKDNEEKELVPFENNSVEKKESEILASGEDGNTKDISGEEVLGVSEILENVIVPISGDVNSGEEKDNKNIIIESNKSGE